MKIYIASYFDTRARLRPIKDKLWAMGHEVVSTWLDETTKMPEMTKHQFWSKLALKDLCEVQSADMLVIDTIDVTERGGREVELGFAIGGSRNKLIFVVGPIRNIFHTLADKQFVNWDECLEHIRIIDALHND